jgi:hypothetical protein
MAEYERKVRLKLSEQGCTFQRHGKGDHDIWYSPLSHQQFPVAVKIRSRYTANAIMKQAGIKYHF